MEAQISKLSELEFGYLIGLFIGDGYSNYNKKDRHRYVEWYLNSKRDTKIIQYLCSLLEKMNLNPLLRKDKRYDVMRIRVNSKNLTILLLNKKEVIRKMKDANEPTAIGLLSGFIDSEGYVGKGEIVVAQANLDTIEFFAEIAKRFGVYKKLWRYQNERCDVWRLRISPAFKYSAHNSCKL